MNSMTGFGQGSLATPQWTLRVELGSVNRKNLDLQISLPRPYAALEAKCQGILQGGLQRGRVQVKIQVEPAVGKTPTGFDVAGALDILREANRFAEDAGLEPIRSVPDLLRVVAALRAPTPVEETDSDSLWALLEPVLRSALAELQTMRAREGAHLREVLAGLLDSLREVAESVEPLLESAKAELEEKLRASVAKLGSASPEMEARLLQEIALYGERSDVREELDRIRGHLDQFREKLDAAEPAGRAMDFLCQELAREFNTLSVKASRADINRLALAGKERVEMLREQVQNVE